MEKGRPGRLPRRRRYQPGGAGGMWGAGGM